MQPFLIKKIIQQKDAVESWLSSYEDSDNIPQYLSTDIRDSGFKVSVVDSNIFPAGFNNICEADLERAAVIFKKSILKKKPSAKNILLVIEEHTRNKWYLENVNTLKTIIEMAEFDVSITTSQGDVFHNEDEIEVTSQKGNTFSLLNPKNALSNQTSDKEMFDLIILNNDLINQIPELLKKTNLETYPSMHVGWHSRLKSMHFKFEMKLLEDFCSIVSLDPWFVSCLDSLVTQVNINEKEDREKLLDSSSQLFSKIQNKYDEYHIKSKPFIFLKANYGTYGMGVLSISDSSQIKNLNRKMRNKLHKGKGSSFVNSYLLQEGVPSIHKVDGMSAEVCLYQIDNQYAGSFFRVHENKTDSDNLNSPGMHFRSIGKDINAPCGDTLGEDLLYCYSILSRVSGVACMKETEHLKSCELDHEMCLSH